MNDLETILEALRRGIGDAVRDHELMQSAADALEKLRAENAELRAAGEKALGAMTELHDDMLRRAEAKIDVIRGEQYRVVNAGNGAWAGFCDALAALRAALAPPQ